MAGKQNDPGRIAKRRSAEEVKKLTQIAVDQFNRITKGGDNGYLIIPRDLYREFLPHWIEAYGARDAHAAVVLYGYLHSYVSNGKDSDAYKWAFPTVKQIVADTGIGKNRINDILQILEDAGLVVTRMETWYGRDKKLYLPLFYPLPPETLED